MVGTVDKQIEWFLQCVETINPEGFVYLLHLDKPLPNSPHNRHYIGWCKDLAVRVQAHQTGHGSRFMAVAKGAGIGFVIARVWRGDRRFERKLKDRKNAPRLCPLCSTSVQMSLFELSHQGIATELIPF